METSFLPFSSHFLYALNLLILCRDYCDFTHWQWEAINNNNIIITTTTTAKGSAREREYIIILSFSFHLKLTPLKCLKEFSPLRPPMTRLKISFSYSLSLSYSLDNLQNEKYEFVLDLILI